MYSLCAFMQRCPIRRRLMSWRRFCNHLDGGAVTDRPMSCKRSTRVVSLTGGTPLPQPIISHWRAANETGELRGHFVDVALHVGGKPHYAHKIVLASASQHLAALLKTGSSSIPVPSCSHTAFEALLTFVYTGCCSIEEAELPALLKAAALLHCTCLVEAATAAVTDRLARPSPRRGSSLSPPSPRPQNAPPAAPGCSSPLATQVVHATVVQAATSHARSGSHVYVLGGLHTASTIERLHTGSGMWESLSAVPLTASRRGVAVAAQQHASPDGGTRFLACGGHAGSQTNVSALVDLFDTRTGCWSTEPGGRHAAVPNLLVARAYACAVSGRDGDVYVVGGHDGSERLKSGEVLKSGRWVPIAHMHTARVCAHRHPTHAFCLS